MLLPRTVADLIALLCEMVIPHFMADAKKILLKYYLG